MGAGSISASCTSAYRENSLGVLMEWVFLSQASALYLALYSHGYGYRALIS
jgi:hypothetical protein